MSQLDFKHRLETDDDWMADGACRGLSDIFFAPLAERPQTRERREARARQVCLQCPVLETCRAYAREHREYGFWGGENEEERHTAGFRLIAPVGVRY
ncbi:MAG: WhiB family transcriptional regulator [Acidimicrobiia bacterium]|nr:WhiB family transcriptional regulator [Acidimicrobiia bacterium]